jgi:hypothetical protein
MVETGTCYRVHTGELVQAMLTAFCEEIGKDIVILKDAMTGAYKAVLAETFHDVIERPSGEKVPKHWPDGEAYPNPEIQDAVDAGADEVKIEHTVEDDVPLAKPVE